MGKALVRVSGGQRKVGLIVETEAYVGGDDLASHASRGKTQRTAVMFGQAGFAYVYFIYGMYHCFNVVTEREGFPAAVLVRSVEPLEGFDKGQNIYKIANGPGKLCRWLMIDRSLNETDLIESKGLYFEETVGILTGEEILAGARIGVNYAGSYAFKPWRFYLKGNRFVSKDV